MLLCFGNDFGELDTTHGRTRPLPMSSIGQYTLHLSVLHTWGSTWGSALTHHPHVHMIVPGGGISLDGQDGPQSRHRLTRSEHFFRNGSPPTLRWRTPDGSRVYTAANGGIWRATTDEDGHYSFAVAL